MAHYCIYINFDGASSWFGLAKNTSLRFISLLWSYPLPQTSVLNKCFFSNEDLISTKQGDLPLNTKLFLYFQIWSHKRTLNSKTSFFSTSKFKILAGHRMSFIKWEIDERFKKFILIPHLLPNHKPLATKQLEKRWRADS